MKKSVQIALVTTCLATRLALAQSSTNTPAPQQGAPVPHEQLSELRDASTETARNAKRAQQGIINKKPAEKSFHGSLQVGSGYWMGDATYSIGGKAWTPEEGTMELPDKISELKFPLDVTYGAIAGNLLWNGRMEICGSFMCNLSDPSSKMEDYDWGVFEGSDSDTLDVYSESDAELSAYAVDVGARFWFRSTTSTNRFAWAVGLGPSIMYQNLDWTISNAEQRYPSHPEMGTETEEGRVGTYNAEIFMPYINVGGLLKYKRVTGRLELGVGPAFVRDEDDHLLRQKRSSGELLGIGAKAAAELRYDMTKHIFALARVSALQLEASGTQTQEGYGGDMSGHEGEIDEDFSLTSVNGGLAIGYGF
jgi:outer membrane protease